MVSGDNPSVKTLVVIVNNEFNNDPRVNRAVTASRSFFDRITVLSGVPKREDRRNTTDGNLQVLRYYYYKPNFSNSGLVKKALNVATGSNEARPSGTGQAKRRPSLFRVGLFLGWFIYILMMNLWIFVRFARLRADVYYANDYDTLLVAYLLSRLHHGELIYDAHELYSDLLDDSPQIYMRLIQLAEGYLARKATAIVTVNNPIAKILETRYHLPQTPMVVYNTPFYQELLERLHIPSPPFKLLYHGLYLPGRNLDNLVRSMQEVECFHLYFRGYGVLEQSLRDLVQDLGLEDRVTFLEPVTMKDLVASAKDFDMGIIPYPGSPKQLNSYYCTPNKVFEYMMAGLALAVSDLPVLREIVTSHQVGVVFDSEDPTGIAAVLNQVKQDDLIRMRENALAVAREVYNFDRESRKLIQIYQDLYQAKK